MTLQRGDILLFQGVEHIITGFGSAGGVELTFPNGTTLRLNRKHIPRGAQVKQRGAQTKRPAPEAQPK